MRRVISGFLIATALFLSAMVAAHADGPLYAIRVGVLDHDTRLANGLENGADINGELQFTSPIPTTWTDPLPAWIAWFARPRPGLGADINTSGYTSQGYVNLTWTPLRFTELFTSADAVTLDLSFGPAVNGGYTNTSRHDHKSLGTNLLFRTGVELGYEITRDIGVYVLYTHSSNAGLSKRNPGLNDIGLRLGYHF